MTEVKHGFQFIIIRRRILYRLHFLRFNESSLEKLTEFGWNRFTINVPVISLANVWDVSVAIEAKISHDVR